MSLKSKQIIRSWHDWPFSLFPYKEADVGIIAGFAKTAGFFSGQWYLCCSHGDIMQISESSGGCVPSSRVSVDPSPTVPCRVSPVIHEVPFQRGPRLPGHCFSRWVARAARPAPQQLECQGLPHCGLQDALMRQHLWDQSVNHSVHGRWYTTSCFFPLGFLFVGGRLFGSHKSEGSFLNFWNVHHVDYKLCDWVWGKITVKAFRHCGQEGSVSLKILSRSSLSQAVLPNPHPWRTFGSPAINKITPALHKWPIRHVVCVCMHVSMCVSLCMVCICTYMWICMSMWVYECIYAAWVCICVSLFTDMSICMYIFVCACMFMWYVQLFMYACGVCFCVVCASVCIWCIYEYMCVHMCGISVCLCVCINVCVWVVCACV